MWLVYFCFKDDTDVDTYHVRTPNKKGVDALFELAKQRGLTAKSKLLEYAFFYSRGTIKPKHVPNFHFYEHNEFVERWQELPGTDESPSDN